MRLIETSEERNTKRKTNCNNILTYGIGPFDISELVEKHKDIFDMAITIYCRIVGEEEKRVVVENELHRTF